MEQRFMKHKIQDHACRQNDDIADRCKKDILPFLIFPGKRTEQNHIHCKKTCRVRKICLINAK